MFYYKQVKNWEIIAYLVQPNEISGNDLIAISEEEYNAFIESIAPSNETILENN